MTTGVRPIGSRRILCPVLIGRERELGQLDALLRESLEGHGHTVLISGEAGVGKTAVLGHFAREARAKGARVLRGECTEVDARRPFGPFMDIAIAADRVASLPTADQGTAGTDRYRLYSAFVTLLADLARERPILIAVEDLHWADEASLELFPHLARKLRDVPLLLVATYRSDELHRRHPLRPVLAEMSRSRVANDIALPRLKENEVAAFLSEAMHLGRPPSHEFRRAMFETCEGNPLFMEEVLRALVERGDVEYHEGSWRHTRTGSDVAIPDSLRDAVAERFRLVSADGQNVLLHAAVIGQRFDFDLLVRVTGAAEASIIGALRAAVDAQLILEPGDGKGADQYVFRHALTRESILLELLQPERRRMHATVGAAIEANAGEDTAAHAEELAYHFDEAGDRVRAFRYHDLAAVAAYRIFAFARSAAHLERALDLAAEDAADLGELRLRLADALFLAGINQRALRAADDARQWFEERGRADRAGVALMRIAWNHWLLVETSLARKAALQAAQALESLGESPELAAACAQVARFAWTDYDPTASAWGQRALDMARRTGALAAEIDALTTLGSLEAWNGRAAGVALLRQAIDLASANGLIEVCVDAMAWLTPALHLTGAPEEEQLRAGEERLAYARRHGYQSDLVPAMEARALLGNGDWDAALQLAQEGHEETLFAAYLALTEAHIRVGREGPALLSLLDAPNRKLRAASVVHQTDSATLCARIALVAGEPARALAYLETVRDNIARHRSPGSDNAIVAGLVAARLLRDDDLVARWMEVAREAPGGRALSARSRRSFADAEQALRSGDLDGAIAKMAECAQTFTQAGSFSSVFAGQRLVELLILRNKAGDRESAQAALAELLPYWRKAKATWYLGQLERWATDLGLELPRAGAPPQDEPRAKLRLTQREREVAALVANGLSNKDIAAKLVISERTAEGHVERILGKLGFRSRAQIASWQAGGDPTARPS